MCDFISLVRQRFAVVGRGGVGWGTGCVLDGGFKADWVEMGAEEKSAVTSSFIWLMNPIRGESGEGRRLQ